MDNEPVRPSGEPFQGAVLFLRALTAGGDGLREWLATHGLAAGAAAWLCAEGLGPYAFQRLREAGMLDRLPPDAQAVAMLRAAYYASAIGHMLLAAELEALLAALRPLGVEPIVLKGMALGTTLYPAARPTGVRPGYPDRALTGGGRETGLAGPQLPGHGAGPGSSTRRSPTICTCGVAMGARTK